MSDLADLYQEIIVDHYKRPRHFGAMADPDARAEGFNPLCGDRVTVYLRLDGERIEEVAFDGAGCAISTASASLLTEALRGLDVEEARAFAARFRGSLTGAGGEEPGDLGKLEALTGVRQYPMRVKCATLAWHAFEAALEGRGEPVSTE